MQKKPVWQESICAEGNPWLKIGGNNYFPEREWPPHADSQGRTPADLRYFPKLER
jgi:hypothetical protein